MEHSSAYQSGVRSDPDYREEQLPLNSSSFASVMVSCPTLLPAWKRRIHFAQSQAPSVDSTLLLRRKTPGSKRHLHWKSSFRRWQTSGSEPDLPFRLWPPVVSEIAVSVFKKRGIWGDISPPADRPASSLNSYIITQPRQPDSKAIRASSTPSVKHSGIVARRHSSMQ
ncbi:hypothetical protein FJT64_020985 [Amphibalanus amphitrite]|uniref:Uncharacterized protein n=1 Tax=Amphibalanus amphitrite TaxID=1232801 RepID=A0A6A4WNV1_AMPAM|nr:hypothetical protein FJT64_020985 [Amphibalanus amphitrite]